MRRKSYQDGGAVLIRDSLIASHRGKIGNTCPHRDPQADGYSELNCLTETSLQRVKVPDELSVIFIVHTTGRGASGNILSQEGDTIN